MPVVQTVIIDNVEPRRDVDGKIIDAHGGCLQFFNGRFYLYGTAYDARKDALDTNNFFCVYSSPDLQQWTYEGKLLKEQPPGVYTRPYVVFNPHTRKYVLWYNWFPKLWDGQAGVATSDMPVGPFTIVNPKAQLKGNGPGDGSLFADDDGTGYYIYTDMKDGYAVRVEKLTPDYSDTTGQTSAILVKGAEAPILFRRNDFYYVLCGSLCPDCPQGNEVYALTATNPLAYFAPRLDWNINRRAGTGPLPVSKGEAGIQLPTTDRVPIISAQQTWVAKIPTPSEPLFIWMGDRWESTPDGMKGHDFQFWSSPLQFDTNGAILPLQNVARWNIKWEQHAVK